MTKGDLEKALMLLPGDHNLPVKIESDGLLFDISVIVVEHKPNPLPQTPTVQIVVIKESMVNE